MSLKSIYFADLLISNKGYHFRYLKGASNPITVVDEIYHAEIKKIVAGLNPKQSSSGIGNFKRLKKYPTPSTVSTMEARKGIFW